MSTAEVGRRRLRIFAFAIALGFGALAVSTWWSSREELRAGSKVVSQSGERMPIEEIPTTYRAVFRSENRTKGELNVLTEKVWVKRPFASRVETYTRGATTGEPSSVRQSAFGALAATSSGTAEPLNVAVTPSLASGDLRPDAALTSMVEDGDILVREQREVFGRRCQVYRTGGSVLAGDLPPYEPGQGEYADVCIDRHGIVLEEYWVDQGELLRRRVATELEVGIPIDASFFDIELEPTPGVERGLVERIDTPPSDEGLPLWILDDAPDGFDRLGRYGVVLPRNAVPSPGGELPPIGPTSTADVYVRGPDLIVVDQDPSLATIASNEGRPTREIELERLEDAVLIVDARMTEVRASTGDGSLVRIFGTLPPDELIELADLLRPHR